MTGARMIFIVVNDGGMTEMHGGKVFYSWYSASL